MGTIKRYGIVADALIMLGGLTAELRSGGVKSVGNGKPVDKLSASIDEEEEEEEDGKDDDKRVNASEVKRYLKLSKDAISDICKIGDSLMR